MNSFLTFLSENPNRRTLDPLANRDRKNRYFACQSQKPRIDKIAAQSNQTVTGNKQDMFSSY